MTVTTSAEKLLDTCRPFTRADAVKAGIDPKVLRGSRFRRIFRGVYILRSVPVNPLVRVQAALVLHPPTGYASHVSAARVYSIPVPALAEEHVTVPRQQDRRRRTGIVSHVAPAGARVTVHRGVRLSPARQMFVELASLLSFVDLVVAGDAISRILGVTAEELVEYCAASTNRHATTARAAAAYVRDEVDSPMETRLRMLIVLAGLPEPEVNVKIRDSRGRVILRLDMSYPALKLIVEYDGRQHAESPAQWNRDLERREYLDDEEWRILVVTARGIFKEPEQTLLRIHRALSARGCDRLPRQLAEEWRPHFPGTAG